MTPPFKRIGPGKVAIDRCDLDKVMCKPPCECRVCQQGFYPMSEQLNDPNHWHRGRLSDVEAIEIAASFVQDEQNAYNELKEILSSHADVAMSRWRKKSHQKRETFLKKTVPELENLKWILFRYDYMMERRLIDSRSLERRRHLLLPWLSVETLKSNPAVLFALWHYRTIYTAADWAAFDYRQTERGWSAGYFDIDFSSKCVVMHGSHYGDLVDWNADSAHRLDILGFPRARLVLEAQTLLMSVLCRIAKGILSDFDKSSPPRTDKWKEQTLAGFKRVGQVELWSPYTNQAFSRPPQFDAAYLSSLAATRSNALRDHLMDLQLNPKYLRWHIKNLSSMGTFRTADEKGAHYMLAAYTHNELGDYWSWRWIEAECQHILMLQRRYGDITYPGSALPRLYDEALGNFEIIMLNEVVSRIDWLKHVIPIIPGESRHWKIERSPDHTAGESFIDRISGNPDSSKALQEDPLDWCLFQMGWHPNYQNRQDHAALSAFLEDHLSHSSAKELSRLDEFVHRKLSDISTCHEILTSLQLHRPRSSNRHLNEGKQSEDRGLWKWLRRPRSEPPEEDCRAMGRDLWHNFYKGNVSSTRGDSPWIEQQRALRAAVDKFWSAMKAFAERLFEGTDFTREETDDLLDVLSADTRKKHFAAIDVEESLRLEAKKDNQSQTYDPDWKWEAEPAESKKDFSVSAPHEKVKTRPEKPSDAEHIQEEIQPEQLAPSAQPPIAVPKRALAIFELMFPDSPEEAKKCVQWDEFVHAMSDAGFVAISNGGSAVRFELSTTDESNGGAIVFHRPHPVPKLDPVMLTGMGRRMAKWFGWSRECFVLRDQVKEEVGS